MDLIRPGLGVLTKGVRDITIMLRDYKPIHAGDQFLQMFTPFLETCTERTKFVERDFDRMDNEFKVGQRNEEQGGE
jgi:hypothetical protein